jgi:hypothetical protein
LNVAVPAKDSFVESSADVRLGIPGGCSCPVLTAANGTTGNPEIALFGSASTNTANPMRAKISAKPAL